MRADHLEPDTIHARQSLVRIRNAGALIVRMRTVVVSSADIRPLRTWAALLARGLHIPCHEVSQDMMYEGA